MPKALKPLTPKQQKFISAFIGPAVEASRLIRNPRIQHELQLLRSKETAVNTLTRNKTLELLTEIATDPNQSASDRIKALDVRNKMNAEYLQRVNVNYEGMDAEQLDSECAEIMQGNGWVCFPPDHPRVKEARELLE